MARYRCLVKWFNNSKGYGFCTAPDDYEQPGADLFVHYRSILGQEGEYKSLSEYDVVELTIVRGDKGLQGVEVEVIDRYRNHMTGKVDSGSGMPA